MLLRIFNLEIIYQPLEKSIVILLAFFKLTFVPTSNLIFQLLAYYRIESTWSRFGDIYIKFLIMRINNHIKLVYINLLAY